VESQRYKPTALSSIHDRVIGIFHPSGRTVAVGPTQPLTEMTTMDISCGVKTAYGLTLPPSRTDCLEILGAPNLVEPSGPVQACNGIAFYQINKCKLVSGV